MRDSRSILALVVVLASTATLAQQHDPTHAGGGYADLQHREIKALSSAQINDLEAGRGMGLSLAAELNRTPGPMHALQLGSELELTASQTQQLETVVSVMRAQAIELGAAIIASERQLDQAFANGSATAAFVDRQAERIGVLNAKLRAVHLKAHLAAKSILTSPQIARYQQARGYGK